MMRQIGLIVLIALLGHLRPSSGAQITVGLQHDMSAPTYGLQGPTSSEISYDDKNGLKLAGTVNDIFGPPIKMLNGFGNLIQGSNMAGVGHSLKSGSAVLGMDAKLLEAAGGAHLLKGGLLMGDAMAKTGLATLKGGLPGKKISSIIEMPVKVVAMKDLATGKTLASMGKLKEMEAQSSTSKGAGLVKQGEQLKAQGMSQMMQGAQEGMQNVASMVQQASGNAATAFKLLPIILDLPMNQQQIQQQQTIEHHPSQADSKVAGSSSHLSPLTGGSIFGGLSSLFPGLASDPALLGQHPAGLFGSQPNGYAAVLNTTNPLANLLLSNGHAMNSFLLPLNTFAQGPLGQSLTAKQPAGSTLLGSQAVASYNLFPGIRMRENSSSSLPSILQPHSSLQQLPTKQHTDKLPAEASKQQPQQQQSQ